MALHRRVVPLRRSIYNCYIRSNDARHEQLGFYTVDNRTTPSFSCDLPNFYGNSFNRHNTATANAQHKKKPCIVEEEDEDGAGFLEEECEILSSSCTETSTSTGNIIERMIPDPSRQREPVLRQWPVIYPKSDEIEGDNPHQYRASLKCTPINQMCFLRVDSSPRPYRLPAIIATLGPSCTTVDTVLELIQAGMNVARINMAHCDPCSKISYIQNVIEATNRYSVIADYTVPIGIMMDLKGPEMRTGRIDPRLVDNPAVPELLLKKDRPVRVVCDKKFENRCSENFIFVDFEALPVHVQPDMEIFIERDIKLRVESIDNLQIMCKVETEGVLRNYQQVHIPILPLPLPSITQCDWECLNIAVEQRVDIVVLPKVRNEIVVYSVKSALEKKEKPRGMLVFAKISNYEGVQNIDRIITAADGIVIHKNDLALEISQKKIFIALKEIIGKCNKAGKPVVCTVELTSNSYDIPQCIIDGADSLLLTTETATGNDGPGDVRRLCGMIREAEAATMQVPFYTDLVDMLTPSIEPCNAIALAAVEVASKIRAAALLTITTSGRTAQLLSWFRPRCPVIAVTRFSRVARQLHMWRAVVPLYYSGPLLNDWFEDCSARIRYGIAQGKDRKMIRTGDPLVLVTGYRKNAGFTNCLRVVFASLEQGNYVDNAKKFFAKSK